MAKKFKIKKSKLKNKKINFERAKKTNLNFKEKNTARKNENNFIPKPIDLLNAKTWSDDWGITGGTFACPGCHPVLGKKFVFQALGKRTIMVNPAGCMTLTATYPYTPYKVPWVHNAIANSASTASGIEMGLKALGKLNGVNIVCYSGDGASYDIGLASLSGAAARNENIIYICYNNEVFANTGYEATTATPQFARTNTTPAINQSVGEPRKRKNLMKIMLSHDIQYAATACTSFPHDFMKKLKKASQIPGFKFIELLAPCIPAWMIESDEGVKVGKALVECGIWPLFEVENKQLTMSMDRNPTMTVEKALKMQGRYKHLTPELIQKISKIIDEEWNWLKQGKLFEADEY